MGSCWPRAYEWAVHSFQHRWRFLCCPCRNPELVMQTQLADTAPADLQQLLMLLRKKANRDVRLWDSLENYAVSRRPGGPLRWEHMPGGSFCWERRVFPSGIRGWQLHTCLPLQLSECLPRWECLLEMAHAAVSSSPSPVAVVRGRNSKWNMASFHFIERKRITQWIKQCL